RWPARPRVARVAAVSERGRVHPRGARGRHMHARAGSVRERLRKQHRRGAVHGVRAADGGPAVEGAVRMEPRRISVVLITQDEEQLMERALRSCLPFADELVVVDGGSRDGSVARARRLGCTVYENPWPGFAKQRNFGLSKARHEWVFL